MNQWARSVQDSPDLDRILALPRREASLALGEAASEFLTPLLRSRAGERTGAKLRPWQALAIQEFVENRGCYLGLSVGGGKSLTGYCAAVAYEAKRPLMLVPGSLLDDTHTKFRKYIEHWRPPPFPIEIVSFEKFQDDDQWDLLTRYQPDMLIIDEAHKLKSHERAVTRRVARYIGETECAVLAMSGSQLQLALSEISHLLTWCLQEGAPIPLNPNELAMWGRALNESEPAIGVRPGIGALRRLGGVGDTVLARARRGFCQRLIETPGVIIADDTECTAPLAVEFICAPEDPVLNDVFRVWRQKRETPDGQRATDVFTQLRYEDEMGSGFYQKWDPPAPEEWRSARNAFSDLAYEERERSQQSKRPLDTEGAVMRKFSGHPTVVEWKEIKPTFVPKSVPTWLSGSVVDFVAHIIRTEHVLAVTGSPCFGEAVAAASGRHFFGRKGLDSSGLFIENEAPGVGAIMSLDANLEGRNLQYLWHDMLIVNCEPNANRVEQLIGRVHRYGQAKSVRVRFLCTSGATWRAWERACEKARFALEMTPHLNKALTVDPHAPRYPSLEKRWAG